VLAVGPAGTGKTIIAARAAMEMLRKDSIERFVFLSQGDTNLSDILGCSADVLHSHVISKRIELLKDAGDLRGRTLHNAFLLLDDMQRSSLTDMCDALQSSGSNSRIVVNGDLMRAAAPSGLHRLLESIERCFETSDESNVDVIRFSADDVIR
jgi:phosphate starvation-inducible PhoH-like protein